jgi:xylan 1,4-beta-xylosidase
VSSDRAHDPVARGRGDSVDDLPDIAGIAATDESGGIQLFISSHHDDWEVTTPSAVTVTLAGVAPGQRFQVTQSLVAKGHGNAYTVWDEMGRPQPPSAVQLAQMHHAAKLKTESVGEVVADGAALTLTVTLPSHSACLLCFVPVIG